MSNSGFQKSCRASSVAVRLLVLLAPLCYLSACLPNHSIGLDSSAQSALEFVPDSDFDLWNDQGKKFDQWNSLSYERAGATKLTYKQLVFRPKLEAQDMDRKIRALPISSILKNIQHLNPRLTLLSDNRVLVSGENIPSGRTFETLADLAVIDPKKKTLTKLQALHVPRNDDAIVQLKDGRVIFIGGETAKKYADQNTDNLTNTVEELDLTSGKTKIIGRIVEARHAVIAEAIGEREILIVGGWNQRDVVRDERWWPCGEILHVRAKDEIGESFK